MKKLLLAVLITSLVFTFASCKEKEANEGTLADHVGIETIEKDSLNIVLNLPDSWTESSSSYQGTEIRHYMSLLEGNGDFFAESVAVTAEKLEKETSVKDYAEANLDALKMTFTDFKLITEPESVKVGSYDGIRAVFSYSAGAYEIVIDQSFAIVGDRAYIIMCNSTAESYEEFLDIFDTARESFKIN